MEEAEASKKGESTKTSPTPHQKTLAALLIIYVLSTLYTVIRCIVFTETDFMIAEAPAIAYFTIQTNIMICLWLGAMIINMMSGNKSLRFAMNINLAATLTSYTAVNAMIFWFVLVPIYAFSGNAPMFTPQNLWMHTITPVIAAVMFNYTINESTESEYKPKPILSMIYPVLYIIFAVIAAINGTYLYPMFNPNLLGGWIGVAVCMAGTIIFVAII